MSKTTTNAGYVGINVIGVLTSSVLLLTGCGPNLSLTRATPAPVTVAPLRQATEAVPANGVINVQSGDSLYDLAARYQVTPQSIIQENNLVAPFTLRTGQSLKIIPPRTHVVRFGDSVNLISQRYAVSPYQLAQLNNLNAPFELTVGQRLQLPMSLNFSILDTGVPEGASPAVAVSVPTQPSQPRKKFVAPKLGAGGFNWPVEGEIITEVKFPVPQASNYQKFVQPASRFALVGVMVCKYDSGVRVAVTGASEDGVFRWSEAEAALGSNFSASALDGLSVAADGMIGDLHGTPEYRAHLIGVMTRRAVAAAA